MEREILEPIAIAHPDGRLRRDAIGWARHPIHDCRLAPDLARVERFNYWCITSRAGALTLLFADVGFLGVVLVSFLDLAARKPVERIHVHPGGLPFAMPDAPRGDLVLDTRRLYLALRAQDERMQIEGDVRTLLGTRVTVDLTITRPMAHETVNVLVPWDDTRFHFTSKQQALPAQGVVRVGVREYRFGPDNDGFACLDFGRGRWPRGIDWRWAFGAATRAGRTLGLNLGGTWTDGSGVTENGVVLDGRVHKIAEAVHFDFDPRAYMSPWRIRTRRTRLDLRFDPLRERAVKAPLGIASAELHQMMGVFSGTFTADDGEVVAIKDMLGLAESFRGRWPGRRRP
jgi:hypothetical protein